jgi:predicted esterase YcpF (UPF0227 family)
VIIYLHGFLSSPASRKAQLLERYLARCLPGEKLVVPALPPEPRKAIRAIEERIVQTPTLIGSSLGGYYATNIAEHFGLRAVLINPAVRPYELLENFLGPQRNLYTGEEFVVTRQHLDELRELEVAHITPERFMVLLESGDETLDYRDAVKKYRGATQIVIEGGDHSFCSFEQWIPRILEFAASERV